MVPPTTRSVIPVLRRSVGLRASGSWATWRRRLTVPDPVLESRPSYTQTKLPMSLLSLERVSKRFNGVPAVDDVSFAVDRGQVVGFLGPNGAGKSTTMRMITQYFEPDAGLDPAGRHARWPKPDGRPSSGSATCRRTTRSTTRCWSPSTSTSWAGLRALRGAGLRSGLDEAIAATGIEQVYHRPIGELSKGFRQRVGLAAAILHRPDLLVLDEPTEGLDPNQRVEIRRLIARAGTRADGHPLDPHPSRGAVHLLPAADHQPGPHRGGRAGGRPDLAGQGRRAGQRRGLGSGRRRADSPRFPGSPGWSAARPDGDRVRITVSTGASDDLRPQIFELAKRSGWTLYELHQEAGSLEDLFRELTTDQQEPA